MPVPIAQYLVALIGYIGGPLMPALTHEPPASSVSISIADSVARVANGDAVRYTVTVSNAAPVETPVTVRLTLSPGKVTDLQASQAAVLANTVAWKHTLKPGASHTSTVTGVVGMQADSPSELAATACVHLTPDAAALACATDLNHVAAPHHSGDRGLAWLGFVAMGFLAVSSVRWLHRKITRTFS